MASVVSMSWQIPHTRFIFEGSSMSVGLKNTKTDAAIIKDETPELSMENNQHYKKKYKI